MSNSRNSPHFEDRVQHITTSIWLSFVFVFGALGNLLLFAAILRKGRITNVTNLFNLNLAVGDFIRIFVFIPVYLAHFEYHEFPPELGLIGCKVLFMIVQSSLTVSIVTLMFMSMERYQAVVKPLKKQMTIRLARYLVIVSWVIGLFTSFCFAMSLNLVTDKYDHVHCTSQSDKSWKTNTLLLVIPATQWLPGVVFMAAYIKIILTLRRNGVVKPSDVTQSSQNRYRRNKRAVRILIIEVVLFMGCLIPFYQHSLAMTFGKINSTGPLTVKGMLIYCLMMTYSLINPFCHIVFNTEFRGEVVKMLSQTKAFCCLERNRVSECPHCRLPGSHMHHTDMQTNREISNTVRKG